MESMNFQLGETLKNRGHFTSVDAAVKLHSLGIRRIEGRHIDGGGPIPPGRVRGTLGWNRAMNHFMLASPGDHHRRRSPEVTPAGTRPARTQPPTHTLTLTTSGNFVTS